MASTMDDHSQYSPGFKSRKCNSLESYLGGSSIAKTSVKMGTYMSALRLLHLPSTLNLQWWSPILPPLPRIVRGCRSQCCRYSKGRVMLQRDCSRRKMWRKPHHRRLAAAHVQRDSRLHQRQHRERLDQLDWEKGLRKLVQDMTVSVRDTKKTKRMMTYAIAKAPVIQQVGISHTVAV
jgi:hypothetical protein